MKIKTSELTGAALDWAVARALGLRPSMFIVQQTGALAREHRYSTDWSQGGPIIEREINLIERDDPSQPWHAVKYDPITGNFVPWDHVGWHAFGPTPLIAAMRCFVASKLGDEADVPEELL